MSISARSSHISTFLMVVLAGAAQAQAARAPSRPAVRSNYRARVLGVFDEATGDPIEGVRVLNLATGASSLTTATGTLSLSYVRDGGGLVRIQKIGYEPLTMPVAISPMDTAPVTVTLRRLTELPAAISTASSTKYLSPALRGFEARRQAAAAGYFIPDTVLRREDGHGLADVMRKYAPSTRFYEGKAGSTFLLRSPRCTDGGPPEVYVDGVPLTGPIDISVQSPKSPKAGSQDRPLAFDLSTFAVSDLAGVEWYPDSDQIPIEYAHTSARCGALFLWTRER